MPGPDSLFPKARSWRDIPQELKARAMTSSGRRRHTLSLLKIILGVAFGAGLLVVAIEIIASLENNPRRIDRAASNGTLRPAPLFKTDGVLTAAWVMRTLELPRSATLTELDLGALQSRLLASGQVRVALLSKVFPNTLSVSLLERGPVARIMIQDSGGTPPAARLVARDGVVFQAEGFAPALLDRLPWLLVPRLARSQGRLIPIEGMDLVSDLLAKARIESEHLLPLFQVVSLERLQSDGEIVVSSPECEGLVFNAREDFFRQLAYLDFIRDTMKPTPQNPLARLDLSLGAAVPAAYKTPAVPLRK
jgi:cell division protein FtsQ